MFKNLTTKRCWCADLTLWIHCHLTTVEPLQPCYIRFVHTPNHHGSITLYHTKWGRGTFHIHNSHLNALQDPPKTAHVFGKSFIYSRVIIQIELSPLAVVFIIRVMHPTKQQIIGETRSWKCQIGLKMSQIKV